MIPNVKPGQSLPPDVGFAYLTARGGHYLLRRGPWFEACVRIEENPGLPEQAEYYRFMGPRIPAHLFARVLAFFDAVRQNLKTEAAALLIFEQDQWDVLIPEQEVSGASVRYKIPTGKRIAGSVHSHPGFAARFSKTDEKDEEGFDGLHIVVSNSGFARPELAIVAVVGGRRIELDSEDVIEGFESRADFPTEWMARIGTTPDVDEEIEESSLYLPPDEPWEHFS